MSGTKHLEIRAAAAAVLAAGLGDVDGGIKEGRRTEPMAEQFHGQVNVFLDFSKPQRADLGGQPDDWITRLRIECCGRADGGLTGEQVADDLATRAYALLAADPSLGGLCMDLMPVGLAWDAEEAEQTVGVTQVLFDAKHRTAAVSISA